MSELPSQPEPSQKKDIKSILELHEPEQGLVYDLLTRVTGITISEIDLETLLLNLKAAQTQNQLTEVISASGNIGVYCPGGLYRSKQLGNLFNQLGFVFADAASVRGETIDRLTSKIEASTQLKIGDKPIDTIFLVLSGDADSRLVSVAPLLKKCKYADLHHETNLILVDSQDLEGDKNVVKASIANHFPWVTAPPDFVKPW